MLVMLTCVMCGNVLAQAVPQPDFAAVNASICQSATADYSGDQLYVDYWSCRTFGYGFDPGGGVLARATPTSGIRVLTAAQSAVVQDMITQYGWQGVGGTGGAGGGAACGPVQGLCAVDREAMGYIFGFMAILPPVFYAIALSVGALFSVVRLGSRGGGFG
jgi:hypothetical protein